MKKNLLVVASLLALNIAFADVKLNKDQSLVQWEVKKVLATGHHGSLPIKSAELKESKGDLVSGKITLDISKVDVTDLSWEWKDKFISHIKSSDFFDVEKYSEVVLNIESITGLKAKGTLTIKNKTNPIEIDFSKKGKVYTGIVTFDRTQYDMIYGSNHFFKNLGDKAISNDVKVDFKIVLE